MVAFTSGNNMIDAVGADETDPATTKRVLIFQAVKRQIAQDGRKPWRLSQKLNDAPYRYTRDVLWASLNSISTRLKVSTPAINFGTEDDFSNSGGLSFAQFVNKRLTGTVSELINGIVESAKWEVN